MHSNQDQLEKAVEEIGGRVTAIAMRHMFLFYGTVPSCEVNKLVQLFADVILNGVICRLNKKFFVNYIFSYKNHMYIMYIIFR